MNLTFRQHPDAINRDPRRCRKGSSCEWSCEAPGLVKGVGTTRDAALASLVRANLAAFGIGRIDDIEAGGDCVTWTAKADGGDDAGPG